MANNPVKPITTYDIPEIVARAYPNATTPNNFSKGFLKPGINSLDSEVFTGDDFKGCYVPDGPDQTVSTCFSVKVMYTAIHPSCLSSTSSRVLYNKLFRYGS